MSRYIFIKNPLFLSRIFALCIVLSVLVFWMSPLSAKPEKTVLLIGSHDMAENLGEYLEAELSGWPGLTVVRFAQEKRGLASAGDFDWLVEAKRLQETVHPDWVVVYLGSKGDAELKGPGGNVVWGEEAWRVLYQARVRALVLSFPDALVWWVGPPTVKHENNSLRHALLSVFIENELRRSTKAFFIDFFSLTSSPRGEFIKKIETPAEETIYARAGKIGFSSEGAGWAASRIAERMAMDLNKIGH